MLAQLLQFLFSGITVGATYALAALGFTLIYNASNVINFAQGEFIMLGGMLAVFFTQAGLPLPAALLLAVVLSALYLVRMQYDSRLLYTQLDRAKAEARQLETEHQRLQVEKRAQATPQRIETVAREKLQMKQASQAITQYVHETAAGTAQ